MAAAVVPVLLAVLAAERSPEPSRLAVTHVAVVDMTGAPLKRDQTVIVAGNRIADVGPAAQLRVPAGARVVDASGKYLVPGLWDMHVHIREVERALPLYVANGVLGVREIGGKDEVFGWRDEIARGRRIGPRIVACGQILDGPDPASDREFTIPVANAAEARKAVADLAGKGAECIKVYDRLPRDAYFAIVAEAKKRRLPVVGHVPLSVTTMEASDAGQRSVEHLGTVLEGSSTIEPELRRMQAAPMPAGGDFSEFPRRIAARGERMLDTYDERRAQALFKRLAKNGTWQVPTLVVKRGQTFIDDLSRTEDDRLKFVPESEKEWWSPQKNFFSRYRTPEYITYRRRLYARELELVGAMHRAGVPIMTGTDVSGAWVFPGFSLHDELALFVEAGLTPMEALQAATRNPAAFLGELGSQGTVERGKRANLVLLDANPLEDIHNTRRIAAVVLDGTFLSRDALQSMLAGAEEAARRVPASR